MSAEMLPQPGRVDLFGRLMILVALGITPLFRVALWPLNRPEDLQFLFLELTMGMAVLGVAVFGLSRRGHVNWPSAGTCLVVLYAAWCLLSALWSRTAVFAVHEFVSLASVVAIYLLIVGSRLPTRSLAGPLVWMIFITAALNALIGNLQFVVDKGPLARTPMESLLAQDVLGYGVQQVGHAIAGKQKIRAWFGNPNFLAAYLVPAWALLAHVLLTRRRERRAVVLMLGLAALVCVSLWHRPFIEFVQRWARGGTTLTEGLAALPDWIGSWRLAPSIGVVVGLGLLAAVSWRWAFAQRAIIALALLGILACIVICRSRSGWLALGLVTVVGALVLWRHRRIRWVHIAVLFLALCVGAAGVWQLRVNRMRSRGWEEMASFSTATSRFYDFALAARMVAQRPLLGWGYGSFKIEYYHALGDDTLALPDRELYRTHLREAKGRPPIHVHNDHFEIAVETGLVGLGLFLALIAWTAVGLGEIALRSPARRETWFALALGCALLALLSDMTLSFPLNLPLTSGLFWALLALAHRTVQDWRTGVGGLSAPREP